MNFCLAFLNCYNLLPSELQSKRLGAPQNQGETGDKVQSLARTIQNVFSGETPDMIALSEIGSEPLGRQLAGALNVPGYELVWSGIPRAAKSQIGLMVLYNPDVFGLIAGSLRVGPASLTERRQWLAMQFRLQRSFKAAFWLVVNHWKSNLGSPSLVEARQVESAQEIGRLYLNEEHKTTQSMILVGDFNCEPGDKAWKGHQPSALVGARERAVVSRGGSGKRGNSKAYFYNPMWRRMGEPADHETAQMKGYQPPYLMGTFVGKGNHMTNLHLWDHLLVSKGLLTGSQIRFVESSLTVVRPETGFTDHCALGARFEY